MSIMSQLKTKTDLANVEFGVKCIVLNAVL